MRLTRGMVSQLAAKCTTTCGRGTAVRTPLAAHPPAPSAGCMPETVLHDLAGFSRALRDVRVLLFKHSPTCPISAHAREQYDEWKRANPDAPTLFVDVIGDRPGARGIAERGSVVRVDHGDTAEDFVRYGKEVERSVLARGLRCHLEDRVLLNGHRTVVFR